MWGHDGPVRTPEQRDEQTVAITTALGLFVVTLIVVGLVAWVLDSVTGLVDGHYESVSAIALVLAGTVAVINLVRSTRR